MIIAGAFLLVSAFYAGVIYGRRDAVSDFKALIKSGVVIISPYGKVE